MANAVDKVLYIAGYGRSGSTVLDIILGNHPDIVSAGELTYLMDDWHAPGRRCACGASYVDCAFWKELPEAVSLSEETARVERMVERRRATVSVLLDTIPDGAKDTYRRVQRGVFSYLTETAGASIVVDSSKSAGDAALRFYALSEIAGLDVYVLHLVRDGRATMASCVRKGSNWALEGHADSPVFPGMRAAAGWTLANGWVMGLSHRYVRPGRYLRVQFEEMTARPARTLEAIGSFMGIDVSMLVDRVERGDNFEVGHNVGGNRIRHNQSIRLQKKKDSDREPWSNLSTHHRFLFALSGQWLNSWMGYSG
jgi:hypothetical protein